jgi:hypothetical protein
MTDAENATAPSRTTTAPAAARSTVLYIAGSGRSGSTLLERMLGTLPGMVNVGELVDLSRRVIGLDELCGCGEPFSACPFWVEVGQKAFGGWSVDVARRIDALQKKVARQRDLPQLMVPPLRNAAFSADLAEYTDLYERLFAAIASVSGARAVIDASKSASLVMGLARADQLDIRMLHLIRDARGVAYSWAKSGVARPHGGDSGSVMGVWSPRITARRWAVLQGQIALTRRFVSAYSFVRYEDLVSDPATEVVRCMNELGLPVSQQDLTSISGRVVDLPTSHGLSGNPSRFRIGEQTLRPDEQWRATMPRGDRRLTTVIAAAPLARYGYFKRSGVSA